MKDDENDAAVLVPLLPENISSEKQTSRSASIYGAVFNISTTMIGAGIMSIPATVKVLGVIPGIVVILAVAFLVEVTVEILLRYTQSGKSTTYAGVAAESFGPSGAILVQICVVITNLGCLIIYLIIIGDVLCGTQSEETKHSGILQEWFGFHWWNSRPSVLLVILLFVLLPLVLFRRVDSLRYTSAVSILLALVFVAISTAMAIYAIWEGKSQKVRLFPDFTNQVSVFDLFTTIPVLVTGFGFHVNVHPIRAELRKPSDMISAIRISLLISIAIYSAIGFFGYLHFGGLIMSDMLLNFDQISDSPTGQLLNYTVRLSYATHLVLVFPLMNYSLRANIDELVFPKKVDLALDTPRFVMLTCALLGFSYTVAIAIPDIWYFFQFMGSTTVVCLSFIFPAAIALRDLHGISTTKDRAMAILVIFFAVMTSAIAISSNFYI